ncbi:hypothetical protein CcCBS67573_g09895 [Chytriomyces confervae]|uniref:F-box domain-containing protein n=1 Tax=Chytriomyces confervae TaxID=246404 RepID=A0A507DL00_9FUNG|nr:hypothetical protein CcCBS67573_g09895 [Chytriomyces confervae]
MKRKRTEKRKGKAATSDTASQAPPVSTAETITAPSETNALIILHTLGNMQAAMATIQTDVAAIKGNQQRLSNQVHELQNRQKKFFTRLKDLPLEVIAQIFSWIPVQSVLKYRRLSTAINQVLLTNQFAVLNVRMSDFHEVSTHSIGGLWLVLPPSYQTAVAKAVAGEINSIVGGKFNHTKKELPESIARLTAVERINLGGCTLTGSIPDVFGALKNLTYLLLRGNKLTGPLPSSFSLLSGLRFLDLSHNQLSGEFPALPNLNDLDSLSVENNRFTGPIPTMFGKPNKLTKLNGWHNCFNVIPATITQLTNLEHLRISKNPISSEIPAHLWNLPSLRVLDISSCNMFGSLAVDNNVYGDDSNDSDDSDDSEPEPLPQPESESELESESSESEPQSESDSESETESQSESESEDSDSDSDSE